MAPTYFAFFLLVCLCSSVSSYQGTMFIPLEPANASYWLDSTDIAVPPSHPQVQLIYDCPPQKMLRDFSSHDITLELWERGYNETRQAFSEAMQNLQNLLMSGVRQCRTGLESLLHVILQTAAYLWTSLIWATACATWYLLSKYTIEMLTLASLYISTVYMVKMAAWIFGDLPISLLKAGLSMVRGISRALWYKRSYNAEKSVEGYLSFKIPQNPPKNSVLQVQYKDGSHAGYATCVTLYNGTNGLLTAYHVAVPGSKVVSTRNGNKVPLSEFRSIMESEKRDLVLLAGPPNWEGTLACKAVQFQSAQNLCKSKASFYAYDGEGWISSNAEIVGIAEGKTHASVLSNTDAGHSGTPYFNGRTVLGVHVGGAKDENFNYMAPIPPVYGLTSPAYEFETTAPQGRLFTQEEIEELIEEFSFSEITSIMGHRRFHQMHDSQRHQAEYEYESGNGQAAASAETTAPDATPAVGRKSGDAQSPAAPSSPKVNTYTPPNKRENRTATAASPTTSASTDTLSEIKQAIMDKIDVHSIEKQVVQALADKAMKKPKSRRRGKRSSKNSQPTSQVSSMPSTPGNKAGKKPQDSTRSDSSPSFTTLNKRKARIGETKSANSTQKWVISQRASGGPSSAQKPN
nr:P1 [Cucurbit aphid-borne yellows virus]WBQ21511.1 P1 [Cucurbit aphid-borne yellows virus]WBQ21529.1 P1 [Cucurbit aphid-borne yellows virus]WBQ21559.1 P1 [Cucurbit aphid-borne yellows virus]